MQYAVAYGKMIKQNVTTIVLIHNDWEEDKCMQLWDLQEILVQN